jgi:hypothetical protein
MADMLTPLQWRSDERPDGSAPSAFCGPTPPFAIDPPALPQTAPLDCTITGLNDKLMPGQLLLHVAVLAGYGLVAFHIALVLARRRLLR